MIVAMLPDFEKIHQPSKRTLSADNLHQIGLAMHNYVFDHKVFPPAVVYGEDGNPLYSWRVLLLPYIEQEHLYSQFKLDEPWDSPNNMPLLAQMPIVYMSPTQHKPKEPYTTHYQVFTAGGAIFEAGPQARQLSLQQISNADGCSNTVLVVEAAEPVTWSKPEDLIYSPAQPLPQLGGISSLGFYALFADGSVHWFPKDIDEKTIRAVITWNGGEKVALEY